MLERKLDHRSRPRRGGLEPQGGRVRIPESQPAAHGEEAECSRPGLPLRDARPVVLDDADELRAVGQLGAHGDLAATRAHQRAVLHRVLHQWLQEEPRKERAARATRHLPVESEMTGVRRTNTGEASAYVINSMKMFSRAIVPMNFQWMRVRLTLRFGSLVNNAGVVPP